MKVNCAVLVPVSTHVEPECHHSLQVLALRGYEVRFLRGCSQVDQARSQLATQAFDDGFAETLWIDSDIVFNPDDVEKLRSHKLPICAGLYATKGARRLACKYLNPGKAIFGKGGGLLEVEYAGFGFVHVRREVYVAFNEVLPRCTGSYDPSKLIVPYFTPSIVPTHDGGKCYLADDSSFFHRARGLGYKIMADTSIRLGHIGKYTYTWDDLVEPDTFETLEVTVQ